MISVGDIEQRLRERVEELARRLLPNARREANYLRVGSIDGEPGASLVIFLAGARKGKWEDFAGTEHGDMLDLIAATQGLAGKGEAVAWAKQWLGIEDQWKPAAKERSQEERRAAVEAARRRMVEQQASEARERQSRMKGARALYLRGEPIAGTPVEAYLRGRLLEPGDAWPGALRYGAECYHGSERMKLPAMLAPFYLADGTHVATHRTFLMQCPRRGWTKIDSPDARLVLGPNGGGFIPINKGASGKPMAKMREGEPIYVTEGIEDAIVVRMKKPEARIIAAGNLGNIGAIVLPAAARRLIVCCDRDESEKEQAKLERAIARQQARGIEVGIVMPPRGIKDLNDWLRQLARQGVA